MADHENAGFQRLFDADDLTFGTGFPLTGASESTPAVDEEMRLAEHAETVGFDALWTRDVPTYWPRFGDAGQTFDTWPWLTRAAARTDDIALGTASVVLTLRHPIHVAKAAASVDRVSDGRLVLGVATGDRDPEYAAFDVVPSNRESLFRESVDTLRTVWREEFPTVDSQWGTLDGDLSVVPDPTTETLPLLPTGHARQTVEWIGDHGDGWLFYHLPDDTLASYLADWREAGGEKPFAMVVRTELADDTEAGPEPVHQGYRAGVEWFRNYFRRVDEMGVDHVLVALESDDPERALSAFAEEVIERV